VNDEFGLLKSIENGFDDIQEIRFENILIEPEEVEEIRNENEMPKAS
jgi:hypothetical protein